jgi:hypothetical protein
MEALLLPVGIDKGCAGGLAPSLQTDRSNTFPFLNGVSQVKREHLELRWGRTPESLYLQPAEKA